MKLKFERREELVPTIWEYYFRPERPLDFAAGQYVDIVLPEVRDDPRGASRVFTLTSQPRTELISFVVKIPEPHSPYKESLELLQLGDPARCNDSMGDLILPKDASLPLVFVGGGIGIASYVSMLQLLIDRREERQVFIFYALRSKYEQIFRDLINAYPLQLKTIVIAPNRLTAQQIIDSTPPNAQIYLSGTERFVEGLRLTLEHLGKPHNEIVFDYFDGYKEL
jgi:glycine betaine catabolism B